MGAEAQYLLALYVLSNRESPPLATGDIADLLNNSSASVTEMVQRLDDDGLVDYEPYKGVTLTEEGRERAASFHETYVTVSWYFRDTLNLNRPETRAMDLAGVLSPNVAERLARELPYDADDQVDAGAGADQQTLSTDDAA